MSEPCLCKYRIVAEKKVAEGNKNPSQARV
jgi:hypothetical protein